MGTVLSGLQTSSHLILPNPSRWKAHSPLMHEDEITCSRLIAGSTRVGTPTHLSSNSTTGYLLALYQPEIL